MMMIQALLRGGIPLLIMGGIAFILYTQGKNSDAKGTLLAALIAFFVAAASVIYHIDHWSLWKQSLVHFFIMLITVYPILLLSGWFTVGSVTDALKILLIFMFIGILLWSLSFLAVKIFSK
ncbi:MULTISPECIES: DUF3021 family protein [Gracilibacillus]|uniref:DUF3021 family protein n=1 Tax=Gracilibacillus TaxID=74385 RepID=UPI000826BB9C|nr:MULTISPECIES: DUF3021 family protein [Gracilibacillus]